MTYVKTTDASGNLLSVESISAVAGGPADAVPDFVPGANQTIITEAEFQTLVAQIRGAFP